QLLSLVLQGPKGDAVVHECPMNLQNKGCMVSLALEMEVAQQLPDPELLLTRCSLPNDKPDGVIEEPTLSKASPSYGESSTRIERESDAVRIVDVSEVEVLEKAVRRLPVSHRTFRNKHVGGPY